MPRSARPRKAYRPRPLPSAPATIRFGAADEDRLQLVPHVSLDLLRRGAADADAWSTLCTRANWGAVLAARYHVDAVPTMRAAQLALAEIYARHGRTGRWGASGPELSALADALVAVDDMQRAHTRRELLDALRAVDRAQHTPGAAGTTFEVTL